MSIQEMDFLQHSVTSHATIGRSEIGLSDINISETAPSETSSSVATPPNVNSRIESMKIETQEKSCGCNCDCSTASIEKSIKKALGDYFEQLDGHPTIGLYDLVLGEVEKPLLESVLDYCKGNQTKAAMMLGINRGTFRKKLKTHGMLEE